MHHDTIRKGDTFQIDGGPRITILNVRDTGIMEVLFEHTNGSDDDIERMTARAFFNGYPEAQKVLQVGDVIRLDWDGGSRVHGRLPQGKVTGVSDTHVAIDGNIYHRTDGFNNPINITYIS